MPGGTSLTGEVVTAPRVERSGSRLRVEHAALRALASSGRIAGSTWFLAVALLVLTWPVESLAPQAGLDFSFAAGLHMAAHEHLQFGTHVIATYGPLGFMRYPFLYYTWTARLALLYTGGVHLLLCFTALWALRRMLALPVSFLLAWLIVAIVASEPESALVVVIVWFVEYLRAGSSPRLKRVFPAIAGAVAGLEVLVKLNTGTSIALLAVIAVLIGSAREWRRLIPFAASFLGTFLFSWFATGQSLGNLGPYISTAREVVGGWSAAMQYPGPSYQIWGALLATLTVFAVVWQSTHAERAGVRAGMLLMWLVLGFSVFKEGFVGQTIGHETIYFATAIGAVLAFGWRGAKRSTTLWGLTVLVAIWFGINQVDPEQLIRPASHSSALVDQVETMASSSRRDRLVANARTAMNATYHLDGTTLAELTGHTVDVIPSEQGILWANKLRWSPVPVFELYYALTPGLDERNAEALESARAPERLLRNLSPPINERNNLFDSPAAQRSMLCHYTAISTTAAYEVLGRVPNRCGSPQLIGTVSARWSQFVQVPAASAPDDLVYVRVGGAGPHGLETLQTLLWRARKRAIGLKQGAGPVRDYALVSETAADGLLMHVPPAADFPGPFSLDAQASELAVGISGESTARALTYSFYEQPITPVAPAPR